MVDEEVNNTYLLNQKTQNLSNLFDGSKASLAEDVALLLFIDELDKEFVKDFCEEYIILICKSLTFEKKRKE